MKDLGLASVLIDLLQTLQRTGSTQILISTEVTDGVTYLTLKDDGIGVFDLESKDLNANKGIKIEQNSVIQGRKISFPLSAIELVNLSVIVETPFKYSPRPIIFNGEKLGGVNYSVSEAMQKIIFKPTSL